MERRGEEVEDEEGLLREAVTFEWTLTLRFWTALGIGVSTGIAFYLFAKCFAYLYAQPRGTRTVRVDRFKKLPSHPAEARLLILPLEQMRFGNCLGIKINRPN